MPCKDPGSRAALNPSSTKGPGSALQLRDARCHQLALLGSSPRWMEVPRQCRALQSRPFYVLRPCEENPVSFELFIILSVLPAPAQRSESLICHDFLSLFFFFDFYLLSDTTPFFKNNTITGVLISIHLIYQIKSRLCPDAHPSLWEIPL